MMLHGFEERFEQDAKVSELTIASVRVNYKKFTGGMAGSLWAKMRLYFMLLPVCAVLAPLASLTFTLPFYARSFSAGAIGLVSLLNGVPFVLAAREMPGAVAPVWAAFSWVLLCAAVLTVLAVVIFLLSLLSFIRVKAFSIALCCISGFGVLAAIASSVVSVVMDKQIEGTVSMAEWKLGIGAFLAVVAFGAVFYANLRLAKEGVTMSFLDGDLERVAIYKRVRAGELKWEDLPQPVVETEKTLEVEARIQADLEGIYIQNSEKIPDELKAQLLERRALALSKTKNPETASATENQAIGEAALVDTKEAESAIAATLAAEEIQEEATDNG
jgi:hypothetical protein